MRAVLSILLGTPAVIVFVLMPARANIMVTVAQGVPMGADSAYVISAIAHTFDKCNPIISDFMGDMAFALKRFDLAEDAYEQGILCAPQQAVFHYKKALVLQNRHKDASAEIALALSLEPNNVNFKELLNKK